MWAITLDIVTNMVEHRNLLTKCLKIVKNCLGHKKKRSKIQVILDVLLDLHVLSWFLLLVTQLTLFSQQTIAGRILSSAFIFTSNKSWKNIKMFYNICKSQSKHNRWKRNLEQLGPSNFKLLSFVIALRRMLSKYSQYKTN